MIIIDLFFPYQKVVHIYPSFGRELSKRELDELVDRFTALRYTTAELLRPTPPAEIVIWSNATQLTDIDLTNRQIEEVLESFEEDVVAA